ncbi:hypothetical protein PsAD2_02237 [Pseudovibrio axinellae]|uniref:Uncharacterized protein n=1 Tax=Pseudovibrio axinellae TaxID=989403 RepID=A0A165YCQ6_9HYPH|nr:hypothetical protein PsAD2_02237 [Pseudovibrio axinellae]SEP95270.1 hypothetical protein SAMN05421798_101804 [Pseudovibrio axinellae]
MSEPVDYWCNRKHELDEADHWSASSGFGSLKTANDAQKDALYRRASVLSTLGGHDCIAQISA